MESTDAAGSYIKLLFYNIVNYQNLFTFSKETESILLEHDIIGLCETGNEQLINAPHLLQNYNIFQSVGIKEKQYGRASYAICQKSAGYKS